VHPALKTEACPGTGVDARVCLSVSAVEFLLDDGTALVKAVLWGPPERAVARLGDLVEVEGKLNANASVEGADPCVGSRSNAIWWRQG
jgi:hypothetical protein